MGLGKSTDYLRSLLICNTYLGAFCSKGIKIKKSLHLAFPLAKEKCLRLQPLDLPQQDQFLCTF